MIRSIMNRLLASCAPAILAAALLWSPDAIAATKPVSVGAPARVVVSQLPKTARPIRYAINFKPNAKDMSFTADVAIDIEVLASTRSIVLNAVDMTFSNAEIAGIGKARIKINAPAQTASFEFAKALKPGKYRLNLAYKGKIYTQAAGLFALDYQTDTGPRRAIFTQFEAPDARRFVPSWDEPNFKATFDVTATVPADEMAVSNMPVKTSKPAGQGLKTVTFQTSPKMSTYLLSFNLGDFERTTTQVGQTELGVVTRRGETAKAQFALQSAKEVLTWYNDYFGTPYPLPKLDHIAAPGQSQFFSAMENWGAIFYFDYALLLDPAFSTQRDKQNVFTTVAHESAHQWFGDLVTMAWWDDLWLNEGFASWMEGRATEKFHPEWNAGLDAVGGRERAMAQDALVTTHPVVQHVTTVEQASQAFDGITYQKGEAVLRMMEGYVGAEAWRSGVRAYMKKHAYGNTVTDDLWTAVEAAAGKPIKAVAHDFTLQPGVPLITVTSSQCVNGSTQLSLAQGEFAPDRPAKVPLSWRVPVSARVVGSAKAVQTLVTGGKADVVLPGCGPVVINDGQTAYFRTIYGPDLMKGLTGAFASLPSIDQLGILSDNWSLGLGGATNPTDALTLVDNLPLDADPQVWSYGIRILRSVDDLYKGSNAEQAAWRSLVLKRLTPLMDRIGWMPKPDEADTVGILRTDLIASLGAFGEPGVIAEARRRLAAEATDPKAVPAPLRRTILGVVARHADAASWDQLRARAKAEKSPLVRSQLYTLLGAAENPELARKALELAITDEPGETTSAGILARVAGGHPDMAFDFAVANLDAVNAKLEISSRTSFIPELGQGSSNSDMIGKIQAFATAHIPADARRNAEESVGAIKERLRIRQTIVPKISAWMSSKVG